MDNRDTEMLNKVLASRDFVRLVLYEDDYDNWQLAVELGEFLVSIVPDGMMGYLLEARGCRHLGDRERAIYALQRCLNLVDSGKVHGNEQEALISQLLKEEQLLLSPRRVE